MFKNGEKGQGLIEFALIILLAFLVGLICFVLPIMLVVTNWPAVVAWGTGLVVGVQAGNPVAIFIAVIILLVALWFIFGRRK